MTVEFFGVSKMPQIGSANKANRTGETAKSGKAENTQGTSFSSTLKDASEAQATGSVADTERAARIEELKAQVADGTYEPDLDKVASSLLKFLVEG